MQTNLPHISVVTPVYGCKTCLAELYLRLKQTLETINPEFEIILVNDASPDGAWETIVELAKKDVRVKGINLSRNFGQHYAITAGLDHAKGEWVVVMDCDLQDQPEEIIKLFAKAQEGYDIVFGQRIVRQDGFLKKMSSKAFYAVFDYLTELRSDPSVANFGIFSRPVIKSVCSMREHNRAFALFVRWSGFKSVNIPIEHSSRGEGKSSYSLKKLMTLAFDAVIAQSNKPLKLSIKFGLLMAFVSFVYGLYLAFKHFSGNVPLGWTSIMVSIFFVGGLIFANLGLLGLYIGKIFNEVKGRPLYVVREVINTEL